MNRLILIGIILTVASGASGPNDQYQTPRGMNGPNEQQK